MGFMELLLVLLVVLLFFGASKLPAIGEGLGKAVRGFREAVRPEPPAGGAPRKELPPSDALRRGPDEPAP